MKSSGLGFSASGAVVWLTVVALAVSFGIGGYGLIEPDEGRNAEVAREMAATDNYVLPHLNGLPYLDKPVLYFAAVAGMVEFMGPTELAARSVSLMFGLATAALVGGFAYRRWGLDAAVVAATAAATAPLALGLSRVVIMDSMLSFFVALALMAFFIAIEKRNGAEELAAGGRTSMYWTLVAWAAMGLGVLTKGPVAIAVPLLAATVYGIRRRSLRTVWHPFGFVTMLIIVLPWVWAVLREVPDFFRYVVVTETWARMTTDELGRTEPFWFFVPVLLFGAFPWSFLVLSNLRANLIPDDPDDRWIRLYLWLWIVLPLVFFSLARGKQEQYVLPLIPAVALLIAGRWSDRQRGVRVAASAWALLGLAALLYASLGMPGLDTSRVSAAVASRTAIFFGVVALVGACVAGFGSVARYSLAVIGLAFPLMMLPVASSVLMKEVAASRSTRGLAAAIEDHLTPLTQLLWIESYAPGMSFYLERPIPVASIDGNELRSNYILGHAEAYFDEAGVIRPLASAWREMAACNGPQFFLFGVKKPDLRKAAEAAGWQQLTKNRRWMVYGPDCSRETGSASEPLGREMVVN